MKSSFRRLSIAIGLSVALAVAACTAAQVQQATSVAQSIPQDVAVACGAANTVLTQAQSQVKGGALDTVNSIGTYVNAGCNTAAGLAQVAASPTGLQWVGQLIGQISAIVNPSNPSTATPS